MVQRAVEIDELTVEPVQQEQSGDSQRTDQSGTAGVGQSTRTAAGQTPVGTAQPAANLDALARQVYGILKDRLRTERNRHELYGR
jgi:hypothetical protein